MLERDGTRGVGRSSPSTSRLAWYGGGGILALCLVGTLAWLARDNTGQPPGEQVAQAAVVEPAPVRADTGGHAAIVDEAQPASAPHEDPPLVLLSPPQQSSAEEAPRPTHAAVVVDEHPAPAAPVRKEVAMHEAVAKPVVSAAAVERPVPKHEPAAAAPAARPAEPKRAAKATHDAPRARPGKQAAAKHAKPAARPKKQASAAQAAEAPVDSDVALISAVIQHSAKHGGSGCDGDAGCAAKATAEP